MNKHSKQVNELICHDRLTGTSFDELLLLVLSTTIDPFAGLSSSWQFPFVHVFCVYRYKERDENATLMTLLLDRFTGVLSPVP